MNKNFSFIPYGRQTIEESDIKAVVEVLQSEFLTQGPVVSLFENAIASKTGAEYSVAVNSATSALHIACLALGLGPGRRLWTSPTSFVASANCALYCRAEVDFVDIDINSGLIDIEALKLKLELAEKNGTLPTVVVPVHLAGTSCDMREIARLANIYGFKVLEDASHAIGGYYQDEAVGNCKYSDITVFSFHPVKIITTGEGGSATTNKAKLAECMYELRSHGITKDSSKFIQPSPGPWNYEQQNLGFNYRMTDIQAALGLSQLKRLDDIIRERNDQLDIYKELLKDKPVKFLEIPRDTKSSVHLAVIRLFKASKTEHRSIFEHLRAEGIGVQLHYSPIHLQPYYKKMGFYKGQFPAAETYAETAISIPLFPNLTKQQQKIVVKIINDALRKYQI